METGHGPHAFADVVVLTAIALVRAGDGGTEAALLDEFVERHGTGACRALVAALAELVTRQAADRQVLAERLEEWEFAVLTGTYWNR
ncbi:hypothetical protein [Kitasatospora cineracea]|uniref:hypothetical protein n=1 Tax=Kitasatospora cineracea TaxID=88074 RepID=UPI00379FDB76